MTEDEAKSRWCPFARVVDTARGADGEGARCIGSACMAWRAGPEALAVLNIIENVQDGRSGRLVAAGYELDEHGLYWRKPLPPGGYCGLAGRPA